MPPTRKAADLTSKSVYGEVNSKGQGPNGFSNAAEMRNEQHEKRLHESGRRYEVKNTEPESQRASPNTAET